jgi:hypothetical protein
MRAVAGFFEPLQRDADPEFAVGACPLVVEVG